MTMPFTLGSWQDSKPITITLKKGENTLQFLRRDPPQLAAQAVQRQVGLVVDPGLGGVDRRLLLLAEVLNLEQNLLGETCIVHVDYWDGPLARTLM